MRSFEIFGESGHGYTITIQRVETITSEIISDVVEIDLQTFSESTFTRFTATAFLSHGQVFLLQADKRTIGTCICMRDWETPTTVVVLSMGIRPGWRGRGLGQSFLSGVLPELKNCNFNKIQLLVGASNRRALKVYQDVGFSVFESDSTSPLDKNLLTLEKAL